MGTKRMAAARAAVVKKLQTEQPQTFKTPQPPEKVQPSRAGIGGVEQRLRNLENKVGR